MTQDPTTSGTKRGGDDNQPTDGKRKKWSGTPQDREKTFAKAAYPQILRNFLEVKQTNPDMPSNARAENTSATLTLDKTKVQLKRDFKLGNQAVDDLYKRLQGSLKENMHAENVVLQEVWRWARATTSDTAKAEMIFREVVRDSKMQCISKDGTPSNKPSCFLCSAIAGSLGIEVEKADRASYENYNIPSFLKDSEALLQQFVGSEGILVYKNGLREGQEQVDAVMHLSSSLQGITSNFSKTFDNLAAPTNNQNVDKQQEEERERQEEEERKQQEEEERKRQEEEERERQEEEERKRQEEEEREQQEEERARQHR